MPRCKDKRYENEGEREESAKKKNRHAALTLRRDWVEQQEVLRCKDKRKGTKRQRRTGKGERREREALASVIALQRGRR